MQEKYLHQYVELFCHRRDIHARQQPDGRYFLIREPISLDLVRRHLQGGITCGWYALQEDNTVRWAVLDADEENGLTVLSNAWQLLNELGLSSYLENSRRGGHLWLFSEPMPAIVPRRLLRRVIEHLDIGGMEVFPKQDELIEDGVGSLVRGPLGRHRRSDKRYSFLDAVTLKPVGRSLNAQLDHLMEVRVNSRGKVAEALARLDVLDNTLHYEPSPERVRNGDELAELKAAIGNLYDFVSQYVDLDERGRGSCPFHPPDRHASFAVNREAGYWVCFHEVNPETGHHLGGDAIEFYRRLNGLDFNDTVTELAGLYGVATVGDHSDGRIDP